MKTVCILRSRFFVRRYRSSAGGLCARQAKSCDVWRKIYKQDACRLRGMNSRNTTNKADSISALLNRSGKLVSVYANLLSVTTETLELNLAVYESEQSIVRTDTYIVTCVNVCTTLSNQDVACENVLTVSTLNAKSLGLGITAVLCGTCTLFMSEIL